MRIKVTFSESNDTPKKPIMPLGKPVTPSATASMNTSRISFETKAKLARAAAENRRGREEMGKGKIIDKKA